MPTPLRRVKKYLYQEASPAELKIAASALRAEARRWRHEDEGDPAVADLIDANAVCVAKGEIEPFIREPLGHTWEYEREVFPLYVTLTFRSTLGDIAVWNYGIHDEEGVRKVYERIARVTESIQRLQPVAGCTSAFEEAYTRGLDPLHAWAVAISDRTDTAVRLTICSSPEKL